MFGHYKSKSIELLKSIDELLLLLSCSSSPIAFRSRCNAISSATFAGGCQSTSAVHGRSNRLSIACANYHHYKHKSDCTVCNGILPVVWPVRFEAYEFVRKSLFAEHFAIFVQDLVLMWLKMDSLWKMNWSPIPLTRNHCRSPPALVYYVMWNLAICVVPVGVQPFSLRLSFFSASHIIWMEEFSEFSSEFLVIHSHTLANLLLWFSFPFAQ